MRTRFARLTPTGADEPVFAEPWQATAFALAIELHARGAFTWTEWTEALSAELKSASSRGEPDDGTQYYARWLAALERLVGERNMLDERTLEARKIAWAEAYHRTPHGKPVEL